MVNQLYEYNLRMLTANLDTEDQFEYSIEKARNGSDTLKIFMNGQEKYIHSKYDPDKEAEREVSNLVIRSRDFCVMFGLGMGYHAKKILRKMGPMNILIIVEPCKTFLKAFLQNTESKDIMSDKRVRFIIFNDGNSFFMELANFANYSNYEDFRGFVLPIYKSLFKEYVDEFFKALSAHANIEHINRNTINALSRLWQLNIFKNLKHILKSYPINSLRGLFNNKPAVIVAGGPSLDKNIDVLKEAEGKIIILATDTVVNSLVQHNIKPNLVFNIDPADAAADKIKVTFDDTPLVFLSVSTYKMMDSHNGVKILNLTNDQFLSDSLSEMNIHLDSLISSGSVATTAFTIALYGGANPIVFIGQDLAYTDNRSHVTGATHAQELETTANLLKVKDIYGKPVYTDRTLISYKNWLESQIDLNKISRDFIDATEGGAYIEGTKVMTLREVVNTYCTENIDPDQIIWNTLKDNPLLNSDNKIILLERYRQLEKNLKDTEELLESLINDSEELKTILSKSQNFSAKAYKRVNKKLSKASKQLNITINNSSELYKNVFSEIFNQNLRYNYEDIKDAKERDIKRMDNNINLYFNLIQSIQYSLPLLTAELEELTKIYGNTNDGI